MPNTLLLALPLPGFSDLLIQVARSAMALAFWQTVVQKFTQGQVRSSHLKMRPGPIRA